MKIFGGGRIYSVDDVSDLLGIPRPTLYRYLREYSIPHLRQGGRIQIPEDSFDRIREARDLHKEGLGTESVRRQIREGTGPTTSDLNTRLNQLQDTLQDLRGDLREKPAATTGEVALSPALRTILARQSLMLSAMFNLTGMVEDLLLSNGKTRRRSVQRYDEDLTVPIAEDQRQLPATIVAEHAPIRRSQTVEIEPSDEPSRTRFGSLARRRRRGVLAIVPVVLLAFLVLLLVPTMDREDPATANGAAPNAVSENRNEPGGGPAAGETEDGEGGTNGTDGAGDRPAEGVAADATPPEAAASPGEEDAATGSEGGIPDVSGQPLEEAARAISESGYTVSAVMIAPGPGEPGTVTATEPAAGTDAPPDTAVVLTMRPDATGAASASPTPASVSASASASPTSASASPSP